jgi:hypothetical protein
VTQNEVLDTQIFVESVHRSAQHNGMRDQVQRFGDLEKYQADSIANGRREN